MDQTASSNNQPTQETASAQTASSQEMQTTASSSKFHFSKKLLLPIILVVALIIVGLLALTLFNRGAGDKVALQAGDKTITQSELDSILNYYEQLEPDAYNKEQSVEFVKNALLENQILKKEYFSLGNTQETLDEEVTKLQAIQRTGSSPPEKIDNIIAENNVMKKAVISTLGIKMVSGEVIMARINTEDESERTRLKELVTERLQTYKQEFDNGAIYQEIRNKFFNDSLINNLDTMTLSSLELVDMSPSRPAISGEEFESAAFDTQTRKLSNIFSYTSANQVTIGMIYVTKKNDGQVTEYRNWLDEQMKSFDTQANTK